MVQFLNQFIINEFDYLFLCGVLKHYKKPRDKITKLLNSGVIIRVKKGIYTLGEAYRKGPVCKEVLANMIFGPSYISLEYALYFYGMISERVETITNITNKRKKIYNTPSGIFTYHYLNPKKYPVGITQYQIDSLRYILIASKETALSDMLERESIFDNMNDLATYLHQNLRIDEEQIRTLNLTGLDRIEKSYNNKNVTLLLKYAKELR
ncbi:hypothetical protein MHK_001435 [Candidatus Magnetomorum sp. HK-1]|nr:hypothetical protein MHK_001435 [Candidatus Magnetomorum sp. HK-1]